MDVILLPHGKCTFLLLVSSQACASSQGCFEKVEEWLDDNKHLLGTIGMVILVVQVRGLVINCSSTLHFFVLLSLFLLLMFSV